MKHTLLSSALIIASITSISTQSEAEAAELSINITNLTNGTYFTPVLVAGHNAETSLFTSGTMASEALKKMAEGGDIGDLDAMIIGADGVTVTNPAEGLLAPATSVSDIMLTTSDSQNYLSIVAMLLPTNDGFVGLSSWPIPTTAGTYTIMLNGYDAGSEKNNELINGGGALGTLGIPVDPGMHGGTDGAGIDDLSENNNVHIHPGVLGDMDNTGGISDLDSRVHRWLNPVAKVTVTVK